MYCVPSALHAPLAKVKVLLTLGEKAIVGTVVVSMGVLQATVSVNRLLPTSAAVIAARFGVTAVTAGVSISMLKLSLPV